MDLQRVHNILDNKEKCDIFYDERPVWIQGVNEHVALLKIYMKKICIIKK